MMMMIRFNAELKKTSWRFSNIIKDTTVVIIQSCSLVGLIHGSNRVGSNRFGSEVHWTHLIEITDVLLNKAKRFPLCNMSPVYEYLCRHSAVTHRQWSSDGGQMSTSKLVDFNNLHLPANVNLAAQHGKMHNADAEDYFFIKRNIFPWLRVPNVAIGRKAYDNFIVAFGIMNNVSVVDATETLTALHQTDDDGNQAGHRNPENDINVRTIGRFNYRRGATSASQYYSGSYVDYTLTGTEKKNRNISTKRWPLANT
jgi:hypothetical protein